MAQNGNRPKKAPQKLEIHQSAARLSPLEYEIAVWVGRGARAHEIAIRLDLDPGLVDELIRSAIFYAGCRNIAELEAKFEPDWARIDEPPRSRWEKVGGRQVLRGGELARQRARQAYAERRERNWRIALERSER